MFSPEPEYIIQPDNVKIRDFLDYNEMFLICPPYQRKVVWSRAKKQKLLDSILRSYYIPNLVLRKIRIAHNQFLWEVVDGQQRINTVQEFFRNELALPSLGGDYEQFSGKNHKDLPVEKRRLMDQQSYRVDKITGIEDPKNPDHQKIATEIFWRLQQGDSLNKMEIAHARLSSLARNFLVRHADDCDFDYESYKRIDENPHKHEFFRRILGRNNKRMHHLALLGRMVLIEIAGGATEIGDDYVAKWVDDSISPNGIGKIDGFEHQAAATEALKTLNLLTEIFGGDPMIDSDNGVKELKVEYFVVSVYMLVRHLRRFYVVGQDEKTAIRDFVFAFHKRWDNKISDEDDIHRFSGSSQQSAEAMEVREQIIRQHFFVYLKEQGLEIKSKDNRRSFNEAERIQIYRRDKGICQMCREDGLSEEEARVSWSKYHADHIVEWVKGGRTDLDNARVLCQRHNTSRR